MEHDIYIASPMELKNGFPPEFTDLEAELTKKLAELKVSSRNEEKFLNGVIAHAAANLGTHRNNLIEEYDDYLRTNKPLR